MGDDELAEIRAKRMAELQAMVGWYCYFYGKKALHLEHFVFSQEVLVLAGAIFDYIYTNLIT